MNRRLLASLLALCALPAAAGQPSDALQPSGRFSVYGHGAAATPPMGFNPWNAFRTEVDQARILSVVDALQQRGLQQAGYRYVNLDDGWWLRRDAQGRIEIRTSMFPIARQADGGTGFRAWTDLLHARGFKAGLYTDAGRNACSQAFDRHSPNLPVGSVAQREIGLQGFEASDLKTMFQDWGFDYLKVDACGLADFGADSEPVRQSGHRPLRPLIVRGDAQRTDADAVETRYARIGRLLADLNPDDDFVLSICSWARPACATGAARTATCGAPVRISSPPGPACCTTSIRRRVASSTPAPAAGTTRTCWRSGWASSTRSIWRRRARISRCGRCCRRRCCWASICAARRSR